MREKLLTIYESIKPFLINIRLYLMDIGGAAGISMTLEEILTGALHWFITVSGTLIGGSVLFLAQKTFLPAFANKINKRFKWNNHDRNNTSNTGQPNNTTGS